ncbi:MAG: neutral zinc metallopeptidase [Bacteroidota bacterium]
MRWWGGRESGNVEYGSGGGGGKLAVGGGIGTLIIAAIVYLLGGNPSQLLNQQQSGGSTETTTEKQGGYDSTDRFVKVVLAQTEDVWGPIFREAGREYRQPKLIQFEGSVQSACGFAEAATGPFYCPADERVYLDKSFFRELKERFNAGGDFANAYVIAHEVGHHVQNLMGTSGKVEQIRRQEDRTTANRYSVMLELQADFYAGIWAHYVNKSGNVVENGDIESALNAANQIGDDRMQMRSKGHVVPDAFTHGTSAQRMYWFKKGFETGDLKQGNTFQELAGLYYYHLDVQRRLATLGVTCSDMTQPCPSGAPGAPRNQ